MAQAKEDNHGTFEKDGVTKVAPSRKAAVDLRFNGWAEKKPATGEAAKTIEAVTTPEPAKK